MKIQIKKFGEFLTSRPAGKEAYLVMKAYMTKDLKKNEPLELDFDGVKVLAPSWADEVITKLFQEYENIKLVNIENSSVKASLETLKKYSGVNI
jgi:hypothetical protein